MAPLPCWLRRALHLEDLERRRVAAPLKLRDPKSLRVGALDVASHAVGVLATAVVKELSKSARVDRPTTWTTFLGLQPADDTHYYYLDNTGTLLLGPCGPGGGPYGRREHGRFRRSDGRNPRCGKGVKTKKQK